MATIARLKFSASTDGQGIKVTQVADPGDLIHTAIAGVGNNNFDEITLYAQNNDAVDRLLTIEFGQNDAIRDYIQKNIPAKDGLVLICSHLNLQNGKVVRAFAAAANVLSIFGYVNRIS